jgi:putative hydrolase of the HAD superfamily
MIKAILFDLGDTLFDFDGLDTRAVYQESSRSTYEFLKARGCPLPSYGRYYRNKLWAVAKAYAWSRLCRRDFSCHDVVCRVCSKLKLGLDEQTLRQLTWRWYEPVCRHTHVAPHVLPTLTRLRDRGLKLAIVSNTLIPGFALDRHLALHGLLELFPVRVYSSEIGYRKPHPAIFEYALQRVGVHAADAVFVGDKVRKDIVGARRAGMRTVLRQLGAQPGPHHTADFVLGRISDLTSVLPMLPAAREPLPIGEELAYEG